MGQTQSTDSNGTTTTTTRRIGPFYSKTVKRSFGRKHTSSTQSHVAQSAASSSAFCDPVIEM